MGPRLAVSSLGVAAALASGLTGCGAGAAGDGGQNASTSSLVAGLSGAAAPRRVDRHPEWAAADGRSICGTNDLQGINTYDGLLGQSVGFARLHKTAVGALTDAATQDGEKYCSGTLVGPDLFLTASHCVDADTSKDFVAFNFEQLPGDAGVAVQEFARISAVVENGGGLDFALLRLEGEPGKRWGWSAVSSAKAAAGDLLTIIQHPLGGVKKIEVGHLLDFTDSYLRYGDLDTEPGSSGSGVLNESGTVIGVHTNGGCTDEGGANSGVRLDAAAASGVLGELAALALPFVDGDDIDLVVTGHDGARLLLVADPETGRVGLVPERPHAARGLEQWRVKALDGGTLALMAIETPSGASRSGRSPVVERSWVLTGGIDGGVALAETFDPADVAQRWRILPTAGGFAVRSGALHDGATWSKWLVPAGSAAGGIALAERAALWDVLVQSR